MLKGKEILGFRPGSTPLLFLEAALRQNGIDPLKDVKLNNNVAIPARVGSWLAGQNQFAHLHRAGRLAARDWTARRTSSPRSARPSGPADYTTFMATDKYIKENPAVIQAWTDAIYKAQKWTAVAAGGGGGQGDRAVLPGRQSEGARRRGRALPQARTSGRATPKIEPKAIERFQDILVQGNVLDNAKRVKFENLVLTEFANKAK